MRNSTFQTTRTRLLLVGLILLAAAWLPDLSSYQVDDAFIFYRYARNLAMGNGFVFNVGEQVEGVSSFVWTIVLAGVYATGLPLPAVTPLLTLTFGLATLAIVARASLETSGRSELTTADLLAPVLLLSLPGFAYWSVGSLEAVPFALLVTLAARQHTLSIRAAEPATHPGAASAALWPWQSACWLGLACLMRPETPVVVGLLALERWFHVGGSFAQRSAGLIRWLGLIAAIFLPFLVFRRLYFGDFLPNTYYAKTGGPLTDQIGAGLKYAQQFVGTLIPSYVDTGWPIWLGGLLLLALLVHGLCVVRLRPFALVALAIGTAATLEGGDWMPLQRFWVPALPALAVLAAAGLLRLAALPKGNVVAAVLSILWVANGLTRVILERDSGQGLEAHAEGYERSHVVIAKYLQAHGQPGEAVALMDIGMIGWHAAQLRIIDITGLTDRAIARAPGRFLDKAFKIDGLFAKNPRYLVLVPRYPADDRIAGHPEFRKRYRLLLKLNHKGAWQPPGEYWLHLFERI